MPNQIMIIHPYRDEFTGLWVFDDPAVGLEREPFVDSATQMIDGICSQKGISADAINLMFSRDPFPEFDMCATLEGPDGDPLTGGNWYHDEAGNRAWLCPALFCYFDAAPEQIHFRVTERAKSA